MQEPWSRAGVTRGDGRRCRGKLHVEYFRAKVFGVGMRDVVDEILAQASAERPQAPVRDMSVALRALRAAWLLDQAARESLASFGAETWEYDVLAALARVGSPYRLTAGALLRSLMVSFGALTHRVDKLVAKGLVTRDVDPDNRRQVLITLTDQGRSLLDPMTVAISGRQAELLGGLTEAERDGLDALLRKLLVSLGDTPDAVGLARRRVA